MQKLLQAVVCVSLTLVGCFGSGGGSDKQGVGGKRRGINQEPSISGSPPPAVLQDDTYTFQPAASDADGDKIRFTIARKPDWAQFDRATGRLSGSPGAADVGVYTDITISVSDGKISAALPAFDISVDQIGDGSATLSWTPPLENADGSTLTNLAGYRIYVGRAANALTRVIFLNNPGLTRYVIEDLSAANWFFAMTAVNSHGKESIKSTPVSKSVH